jgi:aminoglycoside phosphotransferase (APT) family kinase protein
MDRLEHLREDAGFPQLREITDTEKLAQRLRRHLPEELRVEACVIDRLYYSPDGGCRILFTADIRRRHEIGRQVFFGKLFRSQSAQAVFNALERNNLAPPKFGPAVAYIPEWEMILWAYPNDPDLPGLALMADAKKILARAKASPEKFGLARPPAAAAAQMAKYVPGMRCGYIYEMALAATDSQENQAPCRVYGKAYRDDEGEKAYAVMQQIWESAARRAGDLVLPQPYSYDPEARIFWQEALSGQPLAKIAATIPNLSEMAKEIGARLAAFHNLHLALRLKMTLEMQIAEMRQSAQAISRAFPDHAPRCAALGQKLEAAAAKLGPGPLTPVHASFKFSHIFAAAKGVAFIDFDGANLGDPGYDLGRFMAHLYKLQAHGKIAPAAAERTVENFCASYNRAASAPLPQERINWFAASHLLSSQIYKSVKRMDPRSVGKLLEMAERICKVFSLNWSQALNSYQEF